MPRVSVVLNCFNHAAYVREAVASVLGQTWDDLELIAIDNGSTDDSKAVLREFEGESRVRLFLHDENRSISQRLNEGVEAAGGEFVSILYSDDYYLPERIERQVARFEKLEPDYGVVYGPTYGLNERTGERWLRASYTTTGWIFEDLMATRSRDRREIDMCNPLIRRECLSRHRFYEDVFGEGEAIFFRIALTHRFAAFDEPLTVLRDHGGNAGKALVRNCEGWRVCVGRLKTHPDLPPQRRPLVERYEAATLRMYGWWAGRVGADPRWARRQLGDAARLSPRAALHPKWWGAYGLSLLPARARRLVNRIGSTVRRTPGNQVFVPEYEGL